MKLTGYFNTSNTPTSFLEFFIFLFKRLIFGVKVEKISRNGNCDLGDLNTGTSYGANVFKRHMSTSEILVCSGLFGTFNSLEAIYLLSGICQYLESGIALGHPINGHVYVNSTRSNKILQLCFM